MTDLHRHLRKHYGKYSGEVTDNRDDENRGRLKVKVPSVFGEELEVRARPCLPFGHFFVPDPGAKVWVEFEGGDPGYPIWVGTWYPDGTTPQQAAVSPPESRVIQTPSGHTIEIHDQSGEEKITIKHKANAFISIDKNGSVIISNQNGSHIHLNSQGGEATFVEQHGNLLTMNKNGVVIVDKDGSALVELKGDTARVMGTNIVLQGSSVTVGAGAAEPTILGTTFAKMWNLFIFHTHASAVGPTGPPVPPSTPLAPGQGLTSAVVVK